MHILKLNAYLEFCFITKLVENSFESQWIMLMKNAIASHRWFGIATMQEQYKLNNPIRVYPSVTKLYLAQCEYNLPRRMATHANKRIITFLCITPKMRDDKKTGPSPLFEYEKRAISALHPCSRAARSLSFRSCNGTWLSMLSTTPTEVLRGCSRRSCKAWDNVPRRYKSSLLTARFFSFAHSSRDCFCPFLWREKSFRL